MDTEMIIRILWTGGFDSTYRIVQLSQLPVTIQPYYLSDYRASENKELAAIGYITSCLSTNPKTQAKFLPLAIEKYHARVPSKEITEAYKELRRTEVLGSQYDWLARFAIRHKGLELSVSQDERPVKLINKYGKLIKKTSDVIGDYFILDTENSKQEICALFQYYHFPIPTLPKLGMKENYVSWGFEEIMNHTWFCYTPINGEPCGVCVPCKQKIRGGWLTERFSKKALNRYRLYKYLGPIIRMRSGLSRQWKIMTDSK